MKKILTVLLALALLCTALPIAIADSSATFQVRVPDDFQGEMNGRFLVILTNNDRSMPYQQLGVTGPPVFGKTAFGLKAGDVLTFSADDPEVYGYPFQMDAIPVGEYSVQAFLIKYTEFHRSNGSTIWGMADMGGGGSFSSNPYNRYSDVVKSDLTGTVELTLDQEIPLGYELAEGQVAQQGNYADTDRVKYVKIRSECLSEFWGTDMYIGANVLLPADYDETKQYATLYYQGHFPGGAAPLNYGRTNSEANQQFTQFWDSGELKMVVVTIRDVNPFYDTSYSVDSANLGPWGEAITTELIPYLEETFHLLPESWARMLAGGSTGGWESLAMQVFYPDMFGGTWPMCPDGVDFHYYQIVNIYDDANAYYRQRGWLQVERPGSRSIDGNISYMMKDENFYEIAVGGLNAMSLGQWAIWEAVYGPMGEDGYPVRIWDPLTGVINKDVAEYWKQYDLSYILQNNWDTLGDKLVGKIHLRGGDMDAYYLNDAQYLLGDWLETTTAPYYAGYSKTFPRKGHTGNISNYDLLIEMRDHMVQYGPADAAAILANGK